MIPVDIDNFIIECINYPAVHNYIKIKGIFHKIPREIGNCSSLAYLNLCDLEIVDISALYNLKSLKYLALGYNKIIDISALSNCSHLNELYLAYNQIVDISALSNCSSLNRLYVEGNKIKNKIYFNFKTRVYY